MWSHLMVTFHTPSRLLCTVHIVPTIFNGYCKMYEFQQSYKTGSYAGGCILLQFTMYIVVQLMFLLHSRICDSEGQIISCFLI